MTSGPTGSGSPARSARGRDHGRYRRGQVDGARELPPARRRDRLERRDRPPPAADRPRRPQGARGAARPGDPRRRRVPDRERIALRVFKDREALDFLEKLLHPLVSREYLAWREELAKPPTRRASVSPRCRSCTRSARRSASTRSWSSRLRRSCARRARRTHRRPRVAPRRTVRRRERADFRVREHGDAGGARRLGRRRHGYPDRRRPVRRAGRSATFGA